MLKSNTKIEVKRKAVASFLLLEGLNGGKEKAKRSSEVRQSLWLRGRMGLFSCAKELAIEGTQVYLKNFEGEHEGSSTSM